jgi:TnpA family transposase
MLNVTDHVFGLCHLFGFRFAPRIRDIKERKLYLLPDQKAPASLKPIVGGVIDTEHITAHWDELLRLATGTTTSSTLLKKLSAYPRQNWLAKACVRSAGSSAPCSRSIGSRTPICGGGPIYKGEARNALARAVYFCRFGEMRDRTFENQFFRASGLNLLVAAIILWNTRYLEVAYRELRRQGRTVNEDLLRHHPDEPSTRYVIGGERETSGYGARRGSSSQSPRRTQGHVGGTVWRA